MENFEKEMENLKIPKVDEVHHQQLLKIALLNAKKTSQIGIVFIIIPCLFLMGMFVKYFLRIDFQMITALEDWMAAMDKIVYLKWLSPLVLVGLPLAGIVINALAITHFYWNKTKRELSITIKCRLLNIIILLICIAIVATFILYAIGENMGHLKHSE